MPRSLMVSKQKLEEATFFLSSMDDERDLDHFLFKLSAFLTACHSVVDVMLYDFAERFDLRLTREDWIGPHEFDIASRVMGNTAAQEFLTWWRRSVDELNKDQESPWRFRNILTHRGYPKVIVTVIASSTWGSFPRVDESIYSSARASGSTSGTVTVEVQGLPAENGLPAGTTVSWRGNFTFEEITGVGAVEACRRLHKALRSLVSEAERRYWK